MSRREVFGRPGLVVRRAAEHPAPLLSVVATVLVVCTLVSALWGSLSLLQQQALRTALASAPVQDSVLTATSAHDEGQPRRQDRAVRAALAPVVDVAGGSLTTVRQSGSYDAVGRGAATGHRTFAAVTGARLRYVAGRRPRPGPDGAAVEVAVPAVAERLVGRRTVLRSRSEDRRVVAVVVGAWAPPERRRLDPRLAPRSLVLPPADFERVAVPGSGVEWRAVPDLASLGAHDLAPLSDAASAVAAELEVVEERLSATVSTDSGLVALLDGRARELSVLRGLLLVPVGLLVLVAVAGLVLLAAGLAAVRRDEESLLRSRGAGNSQLVRPTLGESLLLCTPVAAVAPLVATAVVRVGEVRPPLTGSAWAASGLAGLGCVVALVVPSVLRAATGDRGQELSAERQRRRGLTAVATLLLLVVALGGFGVVTLRGFDDRVAGLSAHSAGVDPLLVAAPALLLLAVAVPGCLLGLPAALHLVAAATTRGRVGAVLGSRFAARAPGRSVPLALAVTLAVATATFGLVAGESAGAARAARADHVAGADLRVIAPPAAVRAGPSTERRVLARLPDVSTVEPVHRHGAFVLDLQAEVLVADLSPTTASALLGADVASSTWRPLLPGAAGPEDPVPVAMTAALARSAGLAVGDTITLPVLGDPVPLRLAATVDRLRSVAGAAGGVLVDARALRRSTQAAPLGPPQEWWLATDRPQRAAEALADRRDVAVDTTTEAEVLRRLHGDPSTGGAALGQVLRLVLVGALVVGSLVLLSVVLLRRREQAGQAQMIGAAGGDRRDLVGVLAWEHVITTGAGVLVGLPAGALVAWVTLASLTLGPDGEPLVPAPEMVVPWAAVLPAPVPVVLLPLLFLVWQVRRDHGPGLVRRARRSS